MKSGISRSSKQSRQKKKKRFELVRTSHCTNCLEHTLISNVQPVRVACVDNDIIRLYTKTKLISVHRHLTYDHRAVVRRAVVRRTADLLMDDHQLDHRHRVIHIVQDVQTNLRRNLPRQLQGVGVLLINTNLVQHKPIQSDQTNRPNLNDQGRID
jgi:hypothetical protein